MRFRTLQAIRRSLSPFALGVAAMLGCYNQGDGADPDNDHPYYPTGIALSPSGKWLFLANSNFDLAFNAGTVQAYDADEIAKAVSECRANANACTPDPARFVRATVRIGAFAADMRAIQRRNPDGTPVANAGRLLLPVRGDASLSALDFDENGEQITLRCATGARPNDKGNRCSSEWRMGNDAAKSSRGLVLEGEPFGVAISDYWPTDQSQEPANSGGIAAVIHQSTGNVSLFVNVAKDAPTPQGSLAHILGGLPTGGTGIAPLDIVRDGERFIPRFIVTNRSQSNVTIVRYLTDPVVTRSALLLSEVVPIPPQSTGFDTRGVVVDPPGAGETRPTRVFITNRTPAALVVGQIDPVTNKLSFYENYPLPIGPSRLTRASYEVSPGVFKTVIIVASFDARSIVVFDPDSRRPLNVIHTHRGPYGMVFDAKRKVVYISNFTDSTIQVLDIDPKDSSGNSVPVERISFSVGKPSGPTR